MKEFAGRNLPELGLWMFLDVFWEGQMCFGKGTASQAAEKL